MASIMTAQPMRSSMDLAIIRFPRSRNGRSKAQTSPTLTGQSFLLEAPTSIKHCSSVGALVRSVSRSEPMTPGVPSMKRTRLPVRLDQADTAETGKADETILVNVGGHQADLVHMTGQHDLQTAF